MALRFSKVDEDNRLFPWDRNRPRDRKEWAERVDWIEGKLPTEPRGFGVDRLPRPILPSQARNGTDYLRAIELGSLLRFGPPLSESSGELGSLAEPIRWARKQFAREGWGAPQCWTAYSKRRGCWLIYEGSFVDKVLARQSREPHPTTPLFACGLPLATRHFRRAFERALDEEVCEIGSPLFAAAAIFSRFQQFLWEIRYYPRKSVKTGEMEYSSAFKVGEVSLSHILFLLNAASEIGEIWGEIKFREKYEEDTLLRIKAKNRFAQAGPAALNEINTRRQSDARAWQEVARDLASSSRLRGGGLERLIQQRLRDLGFKAPSGRSIRRALKNRT